MCTIDLTVDTTKITILKGLISYNYAPTRTVQVIRVRGVSLAFGVATFVNLDSYLSRYFSRTQSISKNRYDVNRLDEIGSGKASGQSASALGRPVWRAQRNRDRIDGKRRRPPGGTGACLVDQGRAPAVFSPFSAPRKRAGTVPIRADCRPGETCARCVAAGQKPELSTRDSRPRFGYRRVGYRRLSVRTGSPRTIAAHNVRPLSGVRKKGPGRTEIGNSARRTGKSDCGGILHDRTHIPNNHVRVHSCA